MSLSSILKGGVPRPLKRAVQRWLPANYYAEKSWSQCGEDRILLHLLHDMLGGRPVRYVDIGANHPFHYSNTALFYKLGGHGLLVEPNPKLARVLKVRRPRDTVLQCGVSVGGAKQADYFMFDAHTLNTFSAEEAARYVSLGQEQTGVVQVDLRGINEILALVEPLDFVNLDVEGLDFEILQAIDWSRYRPKTFCVETVRFEMGQVPVRRADIIDFMKSKDYLVYADTLVNTIFIEGASWQQYYKP